MSAQSNGSGSINSSLGNNDSGSEAQSAPPDNDDVTEADEDEMSEVASTLQSGGSADGSQADDQSVEVGHGVDEYGDHDEDDDDNDASG
jgi:hypothetical protein